MQTLTKEDLITQATQLMTDFCQNTGLLESNRGIDTRYLWTDAFAVQNCLALATIHDSENWREKAYLLIDEVHKHLGKFKPGDERTGWISGLSEEEGKKHPTINGLRIGKELPERKPGEPYNDREEWSRDGQYFHYHTRWINALLTAYTVSNDNHYLTCAHELYLAGRHFIQQTDHGLSMFWKMSTDLSRPLVRSMGAHDPLEGLIYSYSVLDLVEPTEKDLSLQKKFEALCKNLDWKTSDPLGLGGLMLNTVRAYKLSKVNITLPESISAKKLLSDSLDSLRLMEKRHHADLPANQRLAFRDCGCSLGFHVMENYYTELMGISHEVEDMLHYKEYIHALDMFWLNPKNQEATSWQDHAHINTVTLAASLLSKELPEIYA